MSQVSSAMSGLALLMGEESIVVAPPVPKLTIVPDEPVKQKTERRERPAAGDEDLEWLLLCSEAALGARGTLAGVVSQIERGSVGGSGSLDAAGSYVHQFTDMQLGLGAHARGDIERRRWLISAWRELDAQTQAVLVRRYAAPSAEFRSDSGFGARDRYVEGSDGKAGQHTPTRCGTEVQLEHLAGLAFLLCADPAKLLMACIEPAPIRKGKTNQSETKNRRKVIRDALAAAQAADAEAHRVWAEAKRKVPPMRSTTERRGRPGTYVPATAQAVE